MKVEQNIQPENPSLKHSYAPVIHSLSLLPQQQQRHHQQYGNGGGYGIIFGPGGEKGSVLFDVVLDVKRCHGKTKEVRVKFYEK